MQPEDVLTTLAQLGVAIAGFSGIVVALAKPALGASSENRSLLSVLLLASAGVVIWALAPLVMLSAQMPTQTTWIVSSAGWSIQQAFAFAQRAYQLRSSPESGPRLAVVLPLAFGGLCALGLQLANVFWLGAAWPHLVALVWWVVVAFVIFLRLMHGNASDG
jgi:hypothetical protein